MTRNDGDIWAAYAKGVKRTRTKKSKRHLEKTRAHSLASSRKISNAAKILSASPNTPTDTLSRKASWISPIAADNEIKPLFDRRKERALRQGDIRIEAQIDLHGMTQASAHMALAEFIKNQVRTQRRHLLIITGKGSTGKSVLRSSLPHWLETLPESGHILDLRSAAPKHGGEGAFYLLLKKRKI